MLEGSHTALVTPFNSNGAVDYDCFNALIERQIEGGVDGIVPVGTTGESPTLNMQEHEAVIEAAVRAANGRVKVIAGTGGNATTEALRLTQHAKDAGADATLQVTPYYNKPSQAGLIEHFSRIADVGLPVVLYNIPGRTSRELTLDTVVELSRHPNIVAVKEAAGDVDRVSHYTRACDIEVISGDDALTLPMMMVGAIGMISVATNVVPKEGSDMAHHALAGRWDEARALHAKYHRLFSDLFIETNPVPVKAALAMMGQIEEVYRLPLVRLSDEQRAVLRSTMESYGLV